MRGRTYSTPVGGSGVVYSMCLIYCNDDKTVLICVCWFIFFFYVFFIILFKNGRISNLVRNYRSGLGGPCDLLDIVIEGGGLGFFFIS